MKVRNERADETGTKVHFKDLLPYRQLKQTEMDVFQKSFSRCFIYCRCALAGVSHCWFFLE